MLTCSTCIDCVTRTRKAVRPRARTQRIAATVPGLAKPTRAGLEKHAARFADPKRMGEENAKKTIDAVLAVAAEHGITLSVRPIKTKSRSSSGPSLKDRIREHLAAEHDVDYIAEMEDLSPSRARRLIAEIEEAK